MSTLPSPQAFDPKDNPNEFRTALGRFATGVTVVTTNGPNGPTAMTANSFASVSLAPPLVLWSPAKKSKRHDSFVDAEHFAIHILAADQKDLCTGFAKSAFAFDGIPWRATEENTPVFDGCLAMFECKTFATHEAGDHTIVIGEVLRATQRPGAPLVFSNGAYNMLTLD